MPLPYKYCPIMKVRPAEMVALEELPEKDKDNILPIILLRGWLGSNKIENTMERIKDAVSTRLYIADIDEEFLEQEGNERPVFATLKSCKVEKNGYENWCAFVTAHSNIIPCIQLEDLAHLDQQISYFLTLNRGVAIRFVAEKTLSSTDVVLNRLKTLRAASANANAPVYVILDYGQQRGDVLNQAAGAIGVVLTIVTHVPDAIVIPSCTTFPFDFGSRTDQDIFERMFFNEIKRALPTVNLMYSDRASARAEAMGGGGVPKPRIDYPTKLKWKFFRKEESPTIGYINAAKDLVADAVWNANLRIWGTQRILLASEGDATAIHSPARSTAVRINIHLHTQLHYGASGDVIIDTDDDWVD